MGYQGFNHALKEKKYGKEVLDGLERKFEAEKIDYKRDTYGLYFQAKNWEKVDKIMKEETKDA